MGTLLEALWGYFINRQITTKNTDVVPEIEIAWLMGHQYNDFACLKVNEDWNPDDGSGELLRIEAKSMNIGVDESKGHFDEISENLGKWDILLVLLWDWVQIDKDRVYPRITDHFIGRALEIASLRNQLHTARGGAFVSRKCCPDDCKPSKCSHHGEPLNASGRRERHSGPDSCRPPNVSHAANFGGLVRMLKTDGQEARRVFRELRATNAIANEYITFIHRNYPDEEYNQYLVKEWKELAEYLGIGNYRSLSKKEIVAKVRNEYPEYLESWQSISSS